MSIQIGAYDLIAEPRNRVFNNERIKLYSDVQSNLIELASSCNETTIVIDQLQLGASNNSNFFIDTFIYGSDTYRILDISRDSSIINTSSLTLAGNLSVGNNLIIGGTFTINQPIQSPSVTTSNVNIYANYTNNKPFFLSSNNTDLIALQTNTNRLIIQPNVGIGTTIPKYKLQVEGSIYSANTVYLQNISSNINPNIVVYGNLDVRGSISTPQGFNFGSNILNVSGINIDNSQYQTDPGILLKQRKGLTPLVVINTQNNDNSTTSVFGVSSSGRVYIGTDVSNQTYMTSLEDTNSNVNALFSISMPNTYPADQLFKANGYNTSNQLMISSNAYFGIGTSLIKHPIHIHIQSNVNIIHSLSNMASIGLYHSNMPNKPFIVGYSNNSPVFTIDSSGSIIIGSNTNIFLGSNGIISADRLISSNILFYNSIIAPSNNINITGFNTIEGSYLISSNIINSNLNTIRIQNSATITSSNIDTNIINVTNKAYMTDIYLTGLLYGSNVSNFNGVSTGTEFIPAANGNGSIAHFKSSNVLISINSSYTDELNSALIGLSNGILQVRTYPMANKPISTGISIYSVGSNTAGMLVSSYRPYYQLQRSRESVYNIGINGNNELYFGSSNGSDVDNTLTSLKMSPTTVTVGSSKTFLYANASGSILVSTAGNDPALTTSGGFEVRGYSYFRTGAGSTILYMNGANANIGIGYTTPRKTLDIVGDLIVSANIGIGTTLPRTSLHVENSAYFNNVGIGTTITRSIFEVNGSILSKNVGIGTTINQGILDIYKTGSGSSSIGGVFRDNVIPTYATNADNLLTVRGTGSSATTWRGRITAGGDNNVFLMGEYNSHAWFGAHNAALNAWADVYINPDAYGASATAKVYIGSKPGIITENALITADNASGNVGIGTTLPRAPFHVEGVTYHSTNVGIGTTILTRTLDVTGDINFSGNLYQNNTLFTSGGGSSQWTTSGTNIYITGSNVGIGTTLPNYTLHIDGSVYASGDIIAFSDESIKINREIIANPVSKLNQISGYTFDRIDLQGLNQDPKNKRRHMGLIAQEVNKVFPELIYKNADETLSIAYPNISAVFVEAFHELSKRIEYLESFIKSKFDDFV